MPKVSILMGSDSDLPVMSDSAEILDEFGIDYEITLVSAHRTPERMFEYAKSAKSRGIKVIIAGAGGAAHVAGVTAALTPLPVIGVPIKTAALGGVDSLYSIVQMPSGIPVATVAVNAAKNAGILAARILALSDPALTKKLEDYQTGLGKTVEAKAERLENLGYKNYLKIM
ncbi:MAG: 5-(carboxyamino)imidazole ribonucleotide mutase [Clostridiales bacterium]|nr:5-(carboxyamino)imidazole ribonucleotide mutase [Clostridiales bacterium]MCD8214439.1 5-(carboxyamino)imidazole ribonucleotide mutase [Clostridiales bacterium]